MALTPAQQRLVAAIRSAGDYAEYWPVVNEWVRDAGPAKSLAFTNINRTVAALMRANVVTIDDDGCFHLTKSESRS